ncbi:MAG: hypothetical protein DDT26_02725 [Dehalococcoidia bacterium]|nr:hypothetical protein [Chloroflexota bacterium]
MFWKVPLTLLALLPMPSWALKLSCSLPRNVQGLTYIELDTETSSARAVFPGLLGVVDGEITLTSVSGNGTDGYNLLFQGIADAPEGQEFEFVMHRNSGDWTLFGVGYKLIDGRRHVSSFLGQHSPRCVVQGAGVQ